MTPMTPAWLFRVVEDAFPATVLDVLVVQVFTVVNWQSTQAKSCHLKGNPPLQGSEYLHLLHLITLQCPELLQLRKHNPNAITHRQHFDVVLPLWARINGELVNVCLFSNVFSGLPVKEFFCQVFATEKSKTLDFC